MKDNRMKVDGGRLVAASVDDFCVLGGRGATWVDGDVQGGSL